jgi:hypothetical protein
LNATMWGCSTAARRAFRPSTRPATKPLPTLTARAGPRQSRRVPGGVGVVYGIWNP